MVQELTTTKVSTIVQELTTTKVKYHGPGADYHQG